MLGKLKLSSLPLHNEIALIAFAGMIGAVVALLLLVTVLRKWKYLWTEWFTSVDHKRIGAMYIIVALVMGIRGFADVVMMRSQLALSYGSNFGYLPPYHYDQIFSAHGTIMIFFFAMPMVLGLINLIIPLQIGTRDVAYPFLNSLSFWLFVAGAVLMNISLGVGEFSKAGWSGYPPLSELRYSPGVGVDYYIWALQISGAGTLITAINILVTILKQRAPGMKLMKMPIFSWTALTSSLLIIGAFPILTVALGELTLDRYLGTHFFTNGGGGNMMLYVTFFWAWGHPEVYLLVLPAFGIFSEVVATYSGKPLFGYKSMVWATVTIAVISYCVWLHHFFTMGAGGTVNAVFSISTMIIGIPTGVKMFNWLFTMYRGRVRLTTPILLTIGFIVAFVIGGMAGVMLSIPPEDFLLHNSQFLIAHFHSMLIPGVVFGVVAGTMYWFPKVYGFKLNDRLAKLSFWFFMVGFAVTFAPLYVAGLEGMTRRLNHYNVAAWHLPMIIAAIGVAITAVGIYFFIQCIVSSFIHRKENLDDTGDAWDGRTLEWSVASPAPKFNFVEIPTVHSRDAFWEMKRNGTAYRSPREYHDIHLPKNTSAGVFVGLFSFLFGFAFVWHIWWLVIAGFLALVVTVILRTTKDDIFYTVPASEVEREYEEHLERVRRADPATVASGIGH